MRTFLLPAAAAALIALAPMGMAATSTQGTVKAFDMTALTITLDSGTAHNTNGPFN